MAQIEGTVTQGGADAFAEAQIQTGLEGQTANAFAVQAITYEFDTTHLFVGATCDIELSLTRRTKSAMPNITDTDLIHKWHYGSFFVTGVGQAVQPPLLQEWRPPGDVLIVEDPLFLQIDSSNTALTSTAVVVIEFEIVSIDALSRLQLLTLSL